MDDIEKALKKLSPEEKEKTKDILGKLLGGETKGLDIKKLKERDDIFRVRKGNIRIVYQKKSGHISILAIKRRNEKTYR